ncbi:TetR family transcriptional regulator [Streptomyces sp. Ru73]|uniref:TetR/AcrR family transcriptional regulator n=1 Tax=Streptomyces sp. Ru73 TaxID=2080748 RepID=UPI000CDDEDE7|nr:TetR/AcrR family transcriptional regulator [Streptomyces sp. Ru73]POX39977.1 TetR family transcriptional regulator [Streptomyces sp. Ru73]
MPAARDSLLDAAYAALEVRPWAGVRMVDVAAAAGVSRQTLYNEFGSKQGLARALVRRETEGYLAGVERILSRPAGGVPAEDGEAAAGAGGPAAVPEEAPARLAAAADWTLRTAKANPLVRAVLTGCWNERLPSPADQSLPPPVPGPRTGFPMAPPPVEAPLPGPSELVGRFSDRAVAALEADWPKEELTELGSACTAAVRLTLSCVVAPADPEEVGRLVRGAFAGLPRHPAGR